MSEFYLTPNSEVYMTKFENIKCLNPVKHHISESFYDISVTYINKAFYHVLLSQTNVESILI